MDKTKLPDSYNRLIPVEDLSRDKLNVRDVSPRDELVNSIERDGIENPLVVRKDDGDFLITDGWQRYKAAFQLGWSELPANIFTDELKALRAAERQSIAREWTVFEWAKQHRSYFKQFNGPGISKQKAIRKAADQSSKSYSTVRKHILALETPDELHPLLKKKEKVSEMEWLTLQNYKSNVKDYNGISWDVMAKIGENMTQFSRERAIKVAVATLEYDSPTGVKMVSDALENPDTCVDHLKYRVQGSDWNENNLKINTVIELKSGQKKAIMDHTQRTKTPLSDVVEEQMREFAENLSRQETKLTKFQGE